MVVKFSNEVAKDDIMAIIQNASVNGKLGLLNVNTSCIIRIPPDPKTTTGLFLVVAHGGIISLRACHCFFRCCFYLGNLSLLRFQTFRKNNDILTQHVTIQVNKKKNYQKVCVLLLSAWNLTLVLIYHATDVQYKMGNRNMYGLLRGLPCDGFTSCLRGDTNTLSWFMYGIKQVKKFPP